jgi:hypothetical protein
MRKIPSSPACRRYRKTISITITVALLTLSVPPVIPVALAREAVAQTGNLAHRVRSLLGGVLSRPQQNPGMPPLPPRRPKVEPRRPPTRAEREATVDHLELNPPGDETIKSGSYRLFTAIPRDKNGDIVHGVGADWSSDNPLVLSIQNNGEATAGQVGIAHVTATAGSKSASVTITVTAPDPNPKTAKLTGAGVPNLNKAEHPENLSVGRKQVKWKGETAVGRKSSMSEAYKHAHGGNDLEALMPQGHETQTQSTYDAANAVGHPLGKTTVGASVSSPATGGTETPGSDNFMFGIPLPVCPAAA